MALVPDPTTEPVTTRTNTQGNQEEEGHHLRSADPTCHSPPPSRTAFASVGASPEAEWEDDVPEAEAESEDDVPEAEAESEDDVAAAELESEDDVPGAESEDDHIAADESEGEAEWAAAAAAAAAELADEAKWEDAAPAESEDDDAAPAESEDDDAATAEPEDDAVGEADTGEPDSQPRGWPSNSARRDPRKAELFRRLDAVCEARRLQEARLLKRPPPPVGAGDPDEPIWPPKSRHWRRFRELSATKSSLANPAFNPDENSLSLPPSNKSEEMLSDKVADQGDETDHSSKSASGQIVPYQKGRVENPLPVPSKKIKYSIDTYAVQCGKCRKWRLVPTKIKYDEIREKSRQVPFLCDHVNGWKPGVSCDDPADISQDDGFWAIDRECISQTPLGWERTISIRSEGSSKFADVYYVPPTGKKLRSMNDVENYLQDNPGCGLHISQFSFKTPERLQDYIKRCHRQSKRRRQSKPLELEPNEVLPLILCASNS